MAQRIRVVFGLASFLAGGTERQLLKQLRVYDFQRFDVSLVTLFDLPEKETVYDQLPKEVKVFKFNFSHSLDLQSWTALYSTLKKISPDVVVSSAFFANTVFRLLKIFCGYKVISREHNTYVEKNFFQKITDYILSHLSYKIVGISQTVVDFASAQAHIKKSKFKSILNGVDTDEINSISQEKNSIRKNLRSALKLNDSQKVILNVGRLKKQKDQELLIDGFVPFQKENPDYVLCIVGEGIERSALEKKISAYGAEKSIILLGHKENVYDFFLLADIFILTSRHEGGPNAVLEALAFGLPVISTPIAGVNEYVRDGENGFIVDHTPQDITRALNEVAHLSQGKIEIVKRNAIATSQHFNIRSVAKIYMDLIEECAQSSHL